MKYIERFFEGLVYISPVAVSQLRAVQEPMVNMPEFDCPDELQGLETDIYNLMREFIEGMRKGDQSSDGKLDEGFKMLLFEYSHMIGESEEGKFARMAAAMFTTYMVNKLERKAVDAGEREAIAFASRRTLRHGAKITWEQEGKTINADLIRDIYREMNSPQMEGDAVRSNLHTYVQNPPFIEDEVHQTLGSKL